MSTPLLQRADTEPLETNGARSAHARLGEFLQKNHSVLSGLFLFSLVSAIQTIRTGHFSTGVTYVFPIGEEDSNVSTATLVNSDSDAYVGAPLSAFSDDLAEDSGIDGGSTDDGLPTCVQVFIYFGFLAAHMLMSTSIVNILVLSEAISMQHFMLTNFIVSQGCFFVLLLIAGAAPLKAFLLTLSFLVAGALFLVFSLTLLKDQLQLVGRHTRIQQIAGQDPVIVFSHENQQA